MQIFGFDFEYGTGQDNGMNWIAKETAFSQRCCSCCGQVSSGDGRLDL